MVGEQWGMAGEESSDLSAAPIVPVNLRQKHFKQLMKTEMCKYFMYNRCGKGALCSFAHSLSEIRDKPNLNCTSMCQSFLQTGNCNNPYCTYAHSEKELRTTECFLKTKPCRFAANGRCKHGNNCRFAHSRDELNSDDPASLASMIGGPVLAMTHNTGRQAAAPASETSAPDGAQESRERPSSFPTAHEWNDMSPAQNQGPSPTPGADWPDTTSDHSTRDAQWSPDDSIPSDHSTKADTSATVPTPEGSGDSGEEPAFQSRRGQATADGRRQERRGNVSHSGRHCTTVMLLNVPNFLTQGALVSLLEDLTVCMRGAFDFFYCPWDPYQDRNLGYVIINFFSRAVAAEFEQQWGNQPLLPRTHGAKRLRIVPAALQGRAANLRHFSGFTLAHHEDPRYRPLVRAAPNEVLRPMAIERELATNQHRQQQEEQKQQQRTRPQLHQPHQHQQLHQQLPQQQHQQVRPQQQPQQQPQHMEQTLPRVRQAAQPQYQQPHKRPPQQQRQHLLTQLQPHLQQFQHHLQAWQMQQLQSHQQQMQHADVDGDCLDLDDLMGRQQSMELPQGMLPRQISGPMPAQGVAAPMLVYAGASAGEARVTGNHEGDKQVQSFVPMGLPSQTGLWHAPAGVPANSLRVLVPMPAQQQQQQQQMQHADVDGDCFDLGDPMRQTSMEFPQGMILRQVSMDFPQAMLARQISMELPSQGMLPRQISGPMPNQGVAAPMLVYAGASAGETHVNGNHKGDNQVQSFVPMGQPSQTGLWHAPAGVPANSLRVLVPMGWPEGGNVDTSVMTQQQQAVSVQNGAEQRFDVPYASARC